MGERRKDKKAEYERLLDRDRSPLAFVYNGEPFLHPGSTHTDASARVSTRVGGLQERLHGPEAHQCAVRHTSDQGKDI